MGNAHRPFWVLRNGASGETKVVPGYDCENGMYGVLLTDGTENPTEVIRVAKKKRGKKRKAK